MFKEDIGFLFEMRVVVLGFGGGVGSIGGWWVLTGRVWVRSRGGVVCVFFFFMGIIFSFFII